MSLRWRHVAIVMRKEILDGLRDRRSLLSALLFPLFGPILVSVMFTAILEEQAEDAPLHVPVVGAEHAPALVEHLESSGIVIETPPDDPRAAVSAGEVELVLVIGADFEESFRAGRPAEVELVVDSSRRESRTPIRRTRDAIEGWSAAMGTLRLLARGVDPQIAKAVVVADDDTATPQRQASTVVSVVSIYVMLAIFLGGMFVATDGTAGERERKSLEPLLLNPASRDSIAIGKWLATAAFSAIGLLITLVGSAAALARMPLDEVGLSFELDPVQGVQVVAALLPLSFAAAGMQLLVASFARSFREAQSYLSLLTGMLPTLPPIFLMLYPDAAAAWMSAVPVLGQQALLTEVLRGEPIESWQFLLAGGTAFALGAVCVWLTARLFEREKIIFT